VIPVTGTAPPAGHSATTSFDGLAEWAGEAFHMGPSQQRPGAQSSNARFGTELAPNYSQIKPRRDQQGPVGMSAEVYKTAALTRLHATLSHGSDDFASLRPSKRKSFGNRKRLDQSGQGYRLTFRNRRGAPRSPDKFVRDLLAAFDYDDQRSIGVSSNAARKDVCRKYGISEASFREALPRMRKALAFQS